MRTHEIPSESPPLHYSLGITDLISIVWRRRWCLVVCLTVATCLGAVYYLKAERIYEVKCRLLVQKQEMPVGDPKLQSRDSRDLEFQATQAEIFRSPAVMAEAVERVHWPIPSNPEISPVVVLKERLTARPVMGTNVLSVSLRADDATKGVLMIEALVDSYRQYLSRAEQDNQVHVLEMLAKSEKELRTDLKSLEEQYRSLRERNSLIGSGKHGADAQLALVDQLSSKLAETRGRRIELESQLRVASREGTTSSQLTESGLRPHYINASFNLPIHRDGNGEQTAAAQLNTIRPGIVSMSPIGVELPGAPDFAAIQYRLVQAKVLEKELSTRFGPKHPEMRAVREQVASLMAEEQKALQAGHDMLRRELEAVTANEKQLLEMCEQERNQAKGVDGDLLEEEQVLSQIGRVRTVYDSAVGELRQWQLASQFAADGRSEVRVTMLEPPLAPLHPAWPSPLVLSGICVAIGLFSGFGLIAVREQQARSVLRASEQPRAELTNHLQSDLPQRE